MFDLPKERCWREGRRKFYIINLILVYHQPEETHSRVEGKKSDLYSCQ